MIPNTNATTICSKLCLLSFNLDQATNGKKTKRKTKLMFINEKLVQKAV